MDPFILAHCVKISSPPSRKSAKFWSIRELRTSFTTESTENSHRNTDLNTKSSKKQIARTFFNFKNSFASFRVFREIRVRARSLPFSFFLFLFSALSGKIGPDRYAVARRAKISTLARQTSFHSRKFRISRQPLPFFPRSCRRHSSSF